MAQNYYDNPFKTLEITVESAHDLAPVSKMLRTFAVAWVHPDQKLSTRIDYHGHNNPVWSYKLNFRVDDKFLNNEMAAITFEIYNVAWLRDLPIGTAYLFIHHISPPLVQNSPVVRPVALYVRRPTGHLQGILHVGVSLVNNNALVISGSPFRDELSAFSYQNSRKDEGEDDENIEKRSTKNAIVIQKQLSIPRDVFLSYVDEDDNDNDNDNDGGLDVKRSKDQPKSILKTKSMASTSQSMVTIMHPLPSEVAYHLKKGFYAPEGDELEYGSSVFENWSDPTEINANPWRIGIENEISSADWIWKTEDKVPLKLGNGVLERKVHKCSPRHKRSKSAGGGLFSCFGKGFEFTFAYGTKTAKNRKKFKHLSHHHDGKLHKHNSFS